MPPPKMPLWWSLKVFGDLFELVDGLSVLLRERSNSFLEAMVEVILDKSALRHADGLFHGVKLLRDVDAWLLRFDHGDDALEMTFRPFQALDHVGM
jgi:hypothetical protein